MKYSNTLTDKEVKSFEPSEKIGIAATVDDQGRPHITLLTSMQAAGSKKMIIGEFFKGKSKKYMQLRPDIAFAIITSDKKIRFGRAKWTHLLKEGPEYKAYNMQPMFRYNTYFGINTVHYLDLIEISTPEFLPVGKIVKSAILTKIVKRRAAKHSNTRILKPFAENLFNSFKTFKFISYINDKGFLKIIPIFQCQAADNSCLAFHPGVYLKELSKIKPGQEVAIFCLSMQMESVLIKSKFNGIKKYMGVKLGTADIDFVYNSMIPTPGQIYPFKELKPVIDY